MRINIPLTRSEGYWHALSRIFFLWRKA